MEYEVILKNIIKALERRYPSGASKNNVLRRVLNLDKMGAYRRLNGMVQFRANEIATLCAELDLNPDAIFDLPKGKTMSLNLQLTNYSGYAYEDNELVKKSLELFSRAAADENSRLVIGTNMVPHSIITEFVYLLRLCLCKWVYFKNDRGTNIPFRDINLAEELIVIKRQIGRKLSEFKSTVIIWDQRVIESALDDMRYFYRINILTEEEVDRLREELHNYIDYMDALAARGCYPNSGNPVNFYISSMSLDCNYGFIDSEHVKASILQAFILNQAWSEDTESFQYVRSWMHTLIKSSTLVSSSGELARVDFFNKQRRAIDNFKA